MCDFFELDTDVDFKTLFSQKNEQAAKKHGRFFASGFRAVCCVAVGELEALVNG